MRNPLRMFRRRTADPSSRTRSPSEIFTAGGGNLATANPVTRDLLLDADDAHRRRERDRDTDDATDAELVEPPQDTLHGYEITTADAVAMRILANSEFDPDSVVTLPSGRAVTGREMQRWIDSQ
ncbi:hypothetical protein FB384_004884 [Prauserella sediminis]|uniref:Uncharacterized protein n=1 Tax=Prauserella sediminis TaxID=577680 RepID=A0A839Y1Y7_9PSEU|nr:hypothetical protein [Prauserella sediminis]MBB3665925.1 hypothetical protein [Prauserella sediminis]